MLNLLESAEVGMVHGEEVMDTNRHRLKGRDITQRAGPKANKYAHFPVLNS